MDEKRLVDGATALAEKQSRVIKIEPAERPQNVRLRVAAYQIYPVRIRHWLSSNSRALLILTFL